MSPGRKTWELKANAPSALPKAVYKSFHSRQISESALTWRRGEMIMAAQISVLRKVCVGRLKLFYRLPGRDPI